MPGGLRSVEQRFSADGSDYIAEIQKIIRANREVLDSVRQIQSVKIDADISGFMAKMAAAKAELGSLHDKTVTVTVKYVTVGDKPGAGSGLGADHSEIVRHLKDISTYMDIATDSMGQMEDHLLSIKRDAADSSVALAAQTQVLRANADAHNAAALAVTALAAATGRARGGGGGAGAAALGAAAGAAARGGGGGAGGAGGGFVPWAGGGWQAVRFWGMMGAEVASTVVPALVAAGSAALVGAQGFEQLQNRAQAVYTVGEALGTSLNKTAGQFWGGGNALQKAQDLYEGGVYGLAGAGINVAKSGAGGGFLALGGQTLAMLDRAAAGAVLGITQGGTGQKLLSALGHGTGYLQQFGQIGANLGTSLLNFAPDLPGVGSDLLSTLTGASGLLRSASGLPAPLLKSFFAYEAASRWGPALLGGKGLIGRMLGLGGAGGLGGLISKGGIALGGMGASGSALEGAGLGISAFGEGLAGLTGPEVGIPLAAFQLESSLLNRLPQGAGGVASADVAKWQAAVAGGGFTGAWQPLAHGLTLASAGAAAAPPVPVSGAPIGPDGRKLPAGRVAAGLQAAAAMAPRTVYQQAADQFAQQMGELANAAPQLVGALKDVGLKGTGAAQALQFAQNALLDIPHSFGPGGKLNPQAIQQLKDYAATIGPMTQSGGAFGAAVAGYQIMSSGGMKNLATVNQAMDSMTQIMMGGPLGAAQMVGLGGASRGSPFGAGLRTTLGPVLNPLTAAQAAAGHAQAPATTAQVAQALTGFFTPQSAAAWTGFTGTSTTPGVISTLQQSMDQARTWLTLGAISQPQAAGLSAYEIQQQMGYGSKSPAALAMLEQQGVQAGIPGVSMGESYKSFAKAVNQAADSTKTATAAMTQATVNAANLPAVAATLAQGTSAQIQAQRIAAASADAIAIQQKSQKGGVDKTAASDLVNQIKASGVSGGGAVKSALDAILHQAGVSATMRVKIEAQFTTPKPPKIPNQEYFVVPKVVPPKPPKIPNQEYFVVPHVQKPVIPKIPDQSFNIVGHVIISGGTAGIGGPGGVRLRSQTGMLVPGHGSGDIVPIMAEPGELVVPKGLVGSGAVDHLRGRIPGFQSGGLIGLNPTQGGMVTAAILNENFRALQQEIAALARSGGSFSTGGALPMPAAAQQVIDSFEKTFKSMSNPWGQFATTVLQSLLDSVKNPAKETAAQAKALTSRVTQEVNYAKSVSATTVSDLNLPGMQVATPTRTAQGAPYQYYTDQATIAAGGSVSVQGQMGDYLQAIKSFGGDIKTLGKQGLNKQMLQQLLGAGPIQGDAMAQSILSGPGGAKEANKLWNQINKAANQLGITGAEAVYGVPKSKAVSAKADVTGTGAVHALQTAINTLQGKTVVVKVVLDIESAGGGGGGGGGGKGNVPLTNQVEHALQSHLSGGAAARHIQTATLKQAKRTGTSGLRLPGYAN